MENKEKLSLLFEYIKQFSQLKTKIVKDVSKQPWHLFLKDLPLDDEFVKLSYADEDNYAPLLEIYKPEFSNCPSPSHEISVWLDCDWRNFKENMQLLMGYKLWHNDKAHQKELLEHFYEDVKLAPYQRTELLRLIDKLELNGEALRKLLITSFERAKDSGIMPPKETADFIIYELSGEMEKSMDIANKLAKKAVKRI